MAFGSQALEKIIYYKNQIQNFFPEIEHNAALLQEERNRANDSNVGGLSNQVVRDFHSGRLTEKGKSLVQSYRLSLDPKEIKDSLLFYSKDPIDAPICSYEIASLVVNLVHLSKVINQSLDLPRRKEFIHISDWWMIFDEFERLDKATELYDEGDEHSTSTAGSTGAVAAGTAGVVAGGQRRKKRDAHKGNILQFLYNYLYYYPTLYLYAFASCFRINLRFLGNFYQVCCLLVVLSSYLYHHQYVSERLLLVVALVIAKLYRDLFL